MDVAPAFQENQCKGFPSPHPCGPTFADLSPLLESPPISPSPGSLPTPAPRPGAASGSREPQGCIPPGTRPGGAGMGQSCWGVASLSLRLRPPAPALTAALGPRKHARPRPTAAHPPRSAPHAPPTAAPRPEPLQPRPARLKPEAVPARSPAPSGASLGRGRDFGGRQRPGWFCGATAPPGGPGAQRESRGPPSPAPPHSLSPRNGPALPPRSPVFAEPPLRGQRGPPAPGSSLSEPPGRPDALSLF